MDSEDRYEYPFDFLPNSEARRGIRKIRGMREWFNEDSEILFVAEKLPLEGDGKPLFGANSRKILWAMHQAGLLDRIYDDLGRMEIEVFALQGMVGGRNHPRYSYSAASWSEIPNFGEPVMVKGNLRLYGICIAGWERILDMLEPLGAKKVAVLGKKMIREANGWMKGKRESPAEYGFLWDHEYKGYTVSFYGLPITGINAEAVEYFRMLKREDPF